ncbi:hypothetical protein OIE61_19155 [Streptomyces sp. NBC_01762]|uniref:IS110 family transposase n=1 Tax=unclassified Streptomyces TaxID=2593676 RepID=UPI002DDACA49|nr:MULTISPECIES: transposase [unclassified Streptomyces]WSC45902.1 hypothetical protein OIE61_19155 [Streptomyces sp. NBC_01762]WSJ52484.1 hypothetical protein OG243_24740 [Streptomyces sp. NBC_01318]
MIGVGTETAAQLLIIAGDNPDRLKSEASFAHLCGAANGKSDPVDAYAAATAVLSGRAHGRPKTRDGIVEAIRSLRVVRRSAINSCTQTINQIRTLVVSAPAEIRERLCCLPTYQLIAQTATSTGATNSSRSRRSVANLPGALTGA